MTVVQRGGPEGWCAEAVGLLCSYKSALAREGSCETH
jgi:hypothetical protein